MGYCLKNSLNFTITRYASARAMSHASTSVLISFIDRFVAIFEKNSLWRWCTRLVAKCSASDRSHAPCIAKPLPRR